MIKRYRAPQGDRAPAAPTARRGRYLLWATLLVLTLLAIPFLHGYRMGGNLVPSPKGDSLWHEVMRAGWYWGTGGLPR